MASHISLVTVFSLAKKYVTHEIEGLDAQIADLGAKITELTGEKNDLSNQRLQLNITLNQLDYELTHPEVVAQPNQQKTAAKKGGNTRKRKTMTAAARKAISVRMKKLWAQRRKAKAAVPAKKK